MPRHEVNPFYSARNQWTKPVSAGMQILDLFSGIGGFSLGLERAGMQTAAFCEINPYCQRILGQHWPDTPIYGDIKQLTQRKLHHDGIKHIDLICGGYPCQPFSIAGRQRGEKDPRHLWPEMYRLIREIRPRWVVCENVAGHVELGLDAVLADLEAANYTCRTFIIPACAVGAPHRRDRVWIVAHATGVGREGFAKSRLYDTQVLSAAPFWRDSSTSFTCGIDDGIPDLMDRLQALGNAVVPQIPELIGRAIIAHESQSALSIAA